MQPYLTAVELTRPYLTTDELKRPYLTTVELMRPFWPQLNINVALFDHSWINAVLFDGNWNNLAFQRVNAPIYELELSPDDKVVGHILESRSRKKFKKMTRALMCSQPKMFTKNLFSSK